MFVLNSLFDILIILQGISYLESVFKQLSTYFGSLVTALEETGYEVGTNLFGAPVCSIVSSFFHYLP